MQAQANPTIALAVDLASVNYILNSLGKNPYHEVNALIKTITDQALAVLNPAPAPAPVEAVAPATMDPAVATQA